MPSNTEILITITQVSHVTFANMHPTITAKSISVTKETIQYFYKKQRIRLLLVGMFSPFISLSFL